MPSWLDSWRYSQLASYERNFQGGGWSFDTWNEHQKVMHWALGNDVNSALTLRLPGVLAYTRDVMLPLFQEYVAGTINMKETKDSARQGWYDATTTQGKLNQVQIYRASLGLDGLSEYELCQLHREEMDQLDNTVCTKYDPKEEDNSNTTILVAVLVPVIVVILAATFIFIYMEHKRRSSDAIWKIKKEELKFTDPPEIAGRGTFGLVVKAEYRGTVVAVKRVIPPKNTVGRVSFLEIDNPNTDESVQGGDFNPHSSMLSQGSVPSVSSAEKGQPKRKSSLDNMDDIFEERVPQDVTTEPTDLEAGTSKPATSKVAFAVPVRQSSVGSNVHSSMDTGALTLTSSGQLAGSGSGNGDGPKSKAQWKRFFGYKSSGKDYAQLKQDFIHEMRTLSKLRHPCITTVMGSVIDQRDEPMLVMEYMENGSLYDLLHNETIAIDGEFIAPIIKDIARGARFLHAADPKVIHGDLKAANVLVDGRFRAKIADFGLSAKKKYLGASGTPYWMAPELLRRESTNTAESDVYSFGIILYELYSRKDPYDGEYPASVLDGIVDKKINKRPHVPEGCPAKIAEIYQECIDGLPEKRPTFEEIDLRINRLDSDNIEPGTISFSHRIPKQRRASQETDLIHQVFPKHVAAALLAGRKVEPDRVDLATMFFSDIVGFTTIASKITPVQVSDMLDRLYQKFDDLSEKHDVFKIETIGDAYVGVCNLVKKQHSDHAKRVAEFAVDVLQAAKETPVLPNDSSMGTVRIRIGVHCGPLVARVVGSRNPRYCVFGDTVNTAARMETNSLSMRIQCSDRAADILKKQAPDMNLESRGLIPIKGKGEMSTFFINGYTGSSPPVKPGEIDNVVEEESAVDNSTKKDDNEKPDKEFMDIMNA